MLETNYPLEDRWVEGLPPEEVWLKNRDKRTPTPTDSRGLILIDELIEEVKGYIDQSYEWPLKTSVHHLYWPRCVYEELDEWSDGYVPARRFRELPANKILVPRYFENVLHEVTLPPPMPSPETMRHYNGAWEVAQKLFTSVRSAITAERRARRREEREDLNAEELRVGQEVMEEQLARHFRGVQQHLGALSLVPEEYWPFKPDVPARIAAGQVGDVVRHGRRRHTRDVRQPRDGPMPKAA